MKPAPNFNRWAGIYRWIEFASFGPWLSRCRRAYLGELGRCRHALIFGDGDGRFTADLLRINPDVTIDAVDASPSMLRALLLRAGKNAPRVNAEAYDARVWRPPSRAQGQPYDLVVTHFFLDCLTSAEVRALAGTVRPALAPNALWVVSEFAIPDSRFGKLVAGPLVSLLYWAFGWTTGLSVRQLPDYRAEVARAGFTLKKSRCWLRGLLVSEMWEVNPEIKAG
jgi:SAM-dependent methyltransferase